MVLIPMISALKEAQVARILNNPINLKIKDI